MRKAETSRERPDADDEDAVRGEVRVLEGESPARGNPLYSSRAARLLFARIA